MDSPNSKMGERKNYINGESSSNSKIEIGTGVKEEVLDMKPPYQIMSSGKIGDNGASSSSTNLRSSFISMGFRPSLVDKVIMEKGEDDTDLLLETLFAYSAQEMSNSESSNKVVDDINDGRNLLEVAADSHTKVLGHHRSNSESSDSLDSLFDDKEEDSMTPEFPVHNHPTNEPVMANGTNESKKKSLLLMNFSLNEVNFAMEKLGEDAPITELVDFIFAAQMAENSEDLKITPPNHKIIKEEPKCERWNGTKDKRLSLLEMGFSENQISLAIEKFGPDVPIAKLADSIFSGQAVSSYSNSKKPINDYKAPSRGLKNNFQSRYSNSSYVKKEENNYPIENGFNWEEFPTSKKPKQESFDESSSQNYRYSKPLTSNPINSVDKMVSKPPYFFYGSVSNLSPDSWAKISQFIYAVKPEFADTRFFSALSRKEGYLHNLPMENRSHIIPKSPMSIEELIPNSKKYWPSWDTRKHISSINSEFSAASEICDRLKKILEGSRGFLSLDKQNDVLRQCEALNLIWVGPNKLAQIEPEHLERILGYPFGHTKSTDWNSITRLHSLKNCFQTDTLGYHLSVLKNMFPQGITVLSIFTGIGGAEIALHRLGIKLKGVVSIETSGTYRKILERWWHTSDQTGELVQLEDIQKLTTKKLESLMNKFGGFDFIVSQNPCIDSSSKSSSRMNGDGENLANFDFSLFYEFVRVLQRVRSIGRKS